MEVDTGYLSGIWVIIGGSWLIGITAALTLMWGYLTEIEEEDADV